MTEYDLFLRLLKAETEEAVDAILQEAGYFARTDKLACARG